MAIKAAMIAYIKNAATVAWQARCAGRTALIESIVEQRICELEQNLDAIFGPAEHILHMLLALELDTKATVHSELKEQYFDIRPESYTWIGDDYFLDQVDQLHGFHIARNLTVVVHMDVMMSWRGPRGRESCVTLQSDDQVERLLEGFRTHKLVLDFTHYFKKQRGDF